jgi:hypothetical protein
MPSPGSSTSEQLSDDSDPAAQGRGGQLESAVEQFDRLAEQRSSGLLRQLFEFAMENKKWWLIPIIVVLLLVAAFIFISGTAGPFIYPLF